MPASACQASARCCARLYLACTPWLPGSPSTRPAPHSRRHENGNDGQHVLNSLRPAVAKQRQLRQPVEGGQAACRGKESNQLPVGGWTCSWRTAAAGRHMHTAATHIVSVSHCLYHSAPPCPTAFARVPPIRESTPSPTSTQHSATREPLHIAQRRRPHLELLPCESVHALPWATSAQHRTTREATHMAVQATLSTEMGATPPSVLGAAAGRGGCSAAFVRLARRPSHAVLRRLCTTALYTRPPHTQPTTSSARRTQPT